MNINEVDMQKIGSRFGQMLNKAFLRSNRESLLRGYESVIMEATLKTVMTTPDGQCILSYLDELEVMADLKVFDDSKVNPSLRSMLSMKGDEHYGRLLPMDRPVVEAMIDASELAPGPIRSAHFIMALARTKCFNSLLPLLELSLEEIVELVEDSVEGGELVFSHDADWGNEPANSNNPKDFLEDLVSKCEDGDIDGVVARSHEILRVMDIFLKRRLNHAVIHGEPGVGKTSVANGVVWAIHQEIGPPSVIDRPMFKLVAGDVLRGAKDRSDLELRIQNIFHYLEEQGAIVLMEDMGILTPEGIKSSPIGLFVSDMLSKGDTKCRFIFCGNTDEYERTILERYSTDIIVGQPSVADTTTMLRGLRETYEKHHNIAILDSALSECAEMASKHVRGNLPTTAIDLLDTAAALVVSSQGGDHKIHLTRKDQVENHRRRVMGIKSDNQTSFGARSFTKEEDTIRDIMKRMDQERAEWNDSHDDLQNIADSEVPSDVFKRLQRDGRPLHAALDKHVLELAVTILTGMNLEEVTDSKSMDLENLGPNMKKIVIGQDHACDAVTKAVEISKAGIGDPDKPIGNFLFLGMSGTGKTQTAYALAELVFGDRDRLIQINMSEYQQEHTVSGLIGPPPGYVGHEAGGVMTNSVRRQPYSVLLIDEIDKGHPDVLDIFFQILDKGWCQDGRGRKVEFHNTIIIFTSNLGDTTIQAMCQDEDNFPCPDELSAAVRPDLVRFIKPALLGRMTAVPFYPISRESMAHICKMKLNTVADRLMKTKGIKMSFMDNVVENIVSRCTVAESGARLIDGIINDEILPVAAKQIHRDPKSKELKFG